jgi:2-keto-4-pentenoate hydratase
VRIDGQPAHEGVGGHPIGDPVIPLTWMANHLSVRGIGLRKGEVITTGSCNGIRWLAPGQPLEVDFGGLGVAAIAF